MEPTSIGHDRVSLSYLSSVSDELPDGVRPSIGPDATGVGWVYQYSLRDTTGSHDLADLRAIQDFFSDSSSKARRRLPKVASVGGFRREYQVVVDPQILAGYGIAISDIRRAVDRSNKDVGGRLLEIAEERIHRAGSRVPERN